MMDERMWAPVSARHTLPTFISDLVHTIKICKLVVQLLHKKDLQTLCSIGAQNANSNTLWTKQADHLSNTGQQ